MFKDVYGSIGSETEGPMVKNQKETSGVKGGPQLAASKEIGPAITRQWIQSTT